MGFGDVTQRLSQQRSHHSGILCVSPLPNSTNISVVHLDNYRSNASIRRWINCSPVKLMLFIIWSVLSLWCCLMRSHHYLILAQRRLNISDSLNYLLDNHTSRVSLGYTYLCEYKLLFHSVVLIETMRHCADIMSYEIFVSLIKLPMSSMCDIEWIHFKVKRSTALRQCDLAEWTDEIFDVAESQQALEGSV